MKKRALNEREASEYTGMSMSFLREARMKSNKEGRDHGPPFVKLSKSVRYLISDLDKWLESHRVER